jgi:hemolysin activation/secretion protein
MRWLMAGLLALPAVLVLAEPSATPVQGAGASGDKPQFDILDFQIDGNTVLEAEAVETAIYPHLGPGKTVDDVEKARQALEAAYRKAGYVTVAVEIPEQDVEEGRVVLKVVEGTVEDMHITGSRYYALGKIRQGVPSLAEGQVPHMPTVQEEMNVIAKQSADRSVTPIFRAGTTPGKVEVELKVKDDLPLHGGVEVNSRNTENTTRTRLIGSLRYDNLWQRFHSISMQYQVSPENSSEVDVWSGTYVMPTGLADTKLVAYGIGISSSTQLGANVGGTSVVGTGSIYGTRLVKPLPSSDRFNHSAMLGFDYKNFDQAVSLAGQDASRAPISYASFMASYDGTWRSGQSVTSLSLATHLGIRGVGNDQNEFSGVDEQGNPIGKRPGSRSNFIYFTADIKHQQLLPADFRLLHRTSAQVTDAPLISNEQFAVGGPQSVRGYHQTQQLGDNGVSMSLELQSPHLLGGVVPNVQNFRLLSFVDGGYLWILQPSPGTPSYYKLASAGLGLRIQVFKHLAGELDWAYPFYRQGSVDVGEQRVDFRFAYEF